MNENANKKLEGENLLSHLSDGYHNAQDTIRALDTKTNILTALSVFAFTAVLGFVKAVWDCACGHPEAFQNNLLNASGLAFFSGILLAGVLLFSLVIGVICIWACLATLTARRPDKSSALVATTMLFPYIPPKKFFGKNKAKPEQDAAKKYYDKILSGDISEAGVLAEYHNQINNVAEILGEKIAWNKVAVILFKWQVLTIPVLIALAGILFLLLRVNS